jgi:hypothetical protein
MAMTLKSSLSFVLCLALLITIGCKSKNDDAAPDGPRVEIYVSDAGNFDKGPWKIMKYDEDGKNPVVFIKSNVFWPQDIVFLEDQEVVLVSNLNSGAIARFNATSGAYINNFASVPGGPTRMKIGNDNLLYVLQWQGNGKVLRYKLDGTLDGEFTSVGVNESISMAWDAAGNLYISSFNGGAKGYVRKFDTNGNDMGLFISSGLQGPTNIWFDGSGNMLVNDWQVGEIKKFDQNGVRVSTVAVGLSQPEGVDFLPNGNFLIGNGGTGAVKQYSSNGSFINDLIPSRSGGLLKPNAVIVRKVNF